MCLNPPQWELAKQPTLQRTPSLLQPWSLPWGPSACSSGTDGSPRDQDASPQNSEMRLLPLSCRSFYPDRLFWHELPSVWRWWNWKKTAISLQKSWPSLVKRFTLFWGVCVCKTATNLGRKCAGTHGWAIFACDGAGCKPQLAALPASKCKLMTKQSVK